jgi:hypothetical protein
MMFQKAETKALKISPRMKLRSALFAFLSVLLSCPESKSDDTPRGRLVAHGVLELSVVDNPKIREASGIIASRRYPDVFWTHNDQGSKPLLYGITRAGKTVAEFPVTGAKIEDWEDIAIDDEGHIYVGDIGNNDAKRTELAVHRVREPNPQKPGKKVKIEQTFNLRFPKKPFDCESLFVHHGYGYVISKVFKDKDAAIYRFPLKPQAAPFVLEWVARLPIDSPVTGADISQDGQRLGIVCKSGAYVFRIDGDVAKAGHVAPWHTKFKHEHIEGCCFVPDGLLAISESREIFLFTDEPFRNVSGD